MLGGGKNISEDTWKELVAQVDTNGDGQISFEEFTEMMHKYTA